MPLLILPSLKHHVATPNRNISGNIDRVKRAHRGLAIDGQEYYYRTMQYSAKRGLPIAHRLSLCLSVKLVDHDCFNLPHLHWRSGWGDPIQISPQTLVSKN